MIEPSWRTGAGMALLLALMVIWIVLVTSLDGLIGGLPVLVQALIYLVTGIAWIFPMKPIVRWMLTGRFSKD